MDEYSCLVPGTWYRYELSIEYDFLVIPVVAVFVLMVYWARRIGSKHVRILVPGIDYQQSAIFLLACLLLCLASYFRFSFFFRTSPYVYLSSCPFVSAGAICYSQEQQYGIYSTCFFCLCHLYPTPSRNYFVFIRLVFSFRSSYFSGGVFIVLSYLVRQHLICLP